MDSDNKDDIRIHRRNVIDGVVEQDVIGMDGLFVQI